MFLCLFIEGETNHGTLVVIREATVEPCGGILNPDRFYHVDISIKVNMKAIRVYFWAV
jgi:hypothetical protein